MDEDTELSIRRLTASLFAFPMEGYLLSEHFSRFCREHGLVDLWEESLENSRDRPDLYGGTVAKYAFDRFLHHIFHSRSGEFLDLFARIVADFSRVTSQELPTDLLKKDLPSLGYSGEEIEHRFSHEIAREDLKNSLMERYRDLLINRLTRGNLERLQLYLAHQYDARHGWNHEYRRRLVLKLQGYMTEEILTREIAGIETLLRLMTPDDLENGS